MNVDVRARGVPESPAIEAALAAARRELLAARKDLRVAAAAVGGYEAVGQEAPASAIERLTGAQEACQLIQATVARLEEQFILGDEAEILVTA